MDGASSAKQPIRAPNADQLTAISDASVDVITTRAVLAYVADKPAALREFRIVESPQAVTTTRIAYLNAVKPVTPHSNGVVDSAILAMDR
jgi:ubiquinone/menaquinone biosynthesis C-methylase UbiE